MLKDKLTSKLVNCLGKAKRAADKGSDEGAKRDIKDDVEKVNKYSLKRVSKLFGMMKDKCLMKDTAESRAARVIGVFKSKLKTRIKRKAGGNLTVTEREEIADKVSKAVKSKFPNAINIVTVFKTAETVRRQLRPRRALESDVEVETTYDLDTPPADVAANVDVDLGTQFTVVATDIELEPTTATIEVTEPIQEINAELPSGDGQVVDESPSPDATDAPVEDPIVDAATTTTVSSDGTGDNPVDDPADDEQVKRVDGAKHFALSTTAAICAVLLFV